MTHSTALIISRLVKTTKVGPFERPTQGTIKLCEPALISGYPVVSSLGKNQKSNVFKSSSEACAAFLANYDSNAYARVTFIGMNYDFPLLSISILPDCKTTVFNTARVGVINGKGGETIKYLQVQSGARFQVTRDSEVVPNSQTRLVELRGTSEQISRAEELIKEVLVEEIFTELFIPYC